MYYFLKLLFLLTIIMAFNLTAQTNCDIKPKKFSQDEIIKTLGKQYSKRADCFMPSVIKISKDLWDETKKHLDKKVQVQFAFNSLLLSINQKEEESPKLKIFKKPLKEIVDALYDINTTNQIDSNETLLIKYSWRLADNEVEALDFYSLDDLIKCKNAQECKQEYSSGRDFLVHLLTIEDILTYMYSDKIEDISEDIQTRNFKWENFRTQVVNQYPWELLINGKLYKRNILNSQELDFSGMTNPPDRQFIFLHPSIGIEYVKNADDGSQYEPVLLVEFAGFNFWSYKEDGNIQYPWYQISGISLASTLSDRSGTEDVGFGLLFRFRSAYKIGIMKRNNGDVSIVLGMNLNKTWTEKVVPFKDKFLH